MYKGIWDDAEIARLIRLYNMPSRLRLQEIADVLGRSREAVKRKLSDLKHEGRIAK